MCDASVGERSVEFRVSAVMGDEATEDTTTYNLAAPRCRTRDHVLVLSILRTQPHGDDIVCGRARNTSFERGGC